MKTISVRIITQKNRMVLCKIGGAYSVVQPSIWECRNRCVDQKMLRRVQKTKYYCYVNGRPEYEKGAVNGETNRC